MSGDILESQKLSGTGSLVVAFPRTGNMAQPTISLFVNQ